MFRIEDRVFQGLLLPGDRRTVRVCTHQCGEEFFSTDKARLERPLFKKGLGRFEKQRASMRVWIVWHAILPRKHEPATWLLRRRRHKEACLQNVVLLQRVAFAVSFTRFECDFTNQSYALSLDGSCPQNRVCSRKRAGRRPEQRSRVRSFAFGQFERTRRSHNKLCAL